MAQTPYDGTVFVSPTGLVSVELDLGHTRDGFAGDWRAEVAAMLTAAGLELAGEWRDWDSSGAGHLGVRADVRPYTGRPPMADLTSWYDRAPAMLLMDCGPDGEPCSTTTDRRWLWRLEGRLAPSGQHRQLAADLREYLHQTCEHHWRHFEAAEGDDIGTHDQCLWCHDVVWADERTDPV
jgi:hypothetical protein